MRAPLTWGLRCQEQNLQASTIFLSGATGDVMSGKHGTSWQPYETLRQTPPAVPPVADGRSVSLISACGDGEPDAYSTRRYVGRGPDKQDQPRGDETITNSLSCALLETTNITRHEAEPAFSVAQSSLPHPYMRWTQQWIQTMMQIYASAARLRSGGCPIFFPA